MNVEIFFEHKLLTNKSSVALLLDQPILFAQLI